MRRLETRAVIEELAAIGHRTAGSDAERRAARALALRLRRGGRRGTRVHTFWVRPSWAPIHALLCALGVAGSVVAVSHEWTGLGLALGALLAMILDLSGRLPLLRRLTLERATQNVVSPDPRADADAKKVRLILTAAVDAPRAGLTRGAGARLAARVRAATGGRLPGVHGVALLALLAVVACCVVRVVQSDDSPTWLGAIQLVPSAVLIALLARFLDHATSAVSEAGANADASAAAAVLTVAETLDRRPPRNLAVDVIFAGAGHAHALGMRRWVAEARRDGLKAEQVAVLHVAPCGTGTPVWWTRDGLVVPLRYHPRLLSLTGTVAKAESALKARPTQSRGTSGARAARGRRWPAIAIGALPANGVVPHAGTDDDIPATTDPQAVEATVAFALALIAALDHDLA